MSEEIVNSVFKQKLAEARAEQEARAVETEFEGFPVKVIPLPYSVFLVSGRMPGYLTDLVLAEPGEKAAQKRELTTEEVKEGEAFRCKAVCRVMVSPRILDFADYAAEVGRRNRWREEIEEERRSALSRATSQTQRAEIEGRFDERVKAEEDGRPALYLYADMVETAPKLISAVFQWIMRGCPMPEEKKGEGVLGVKDLARFPDSERKGAGAKSRHTRKRRRKATVGADAVR